jgi:hypothetical protein
MKHRPGICSKISFNKDPLEYMMPHKYDQKFIKEQAEKRYWRHDSELKGMNRRAHNAEISLGLIIMVILTTLIFCFCKHY